MIEMKRLKTIPTFCAPMVALIVATTCGSASADPIIPLYSVNQAFLDHEASSNPSMVNGQFTYGYTNNPYAVNPNTAGPYGGIMTTGLTHTSSWAGKTGLQGFYVNNSAIVPAIIANVTGTPILTDFGVTVAPGELLLHPGGTGSSSYDTPIFDADIQYRATSNGYYRINGSFNMLDVGTPDVHVFINGVSVFDSSVSSVPAVFDINQSLYAGDTVDFLVGTNPNGSIGNDSTGLYANLELVPEPSTLISSGIAALLSLGFVLRRRKLARAA